VYFVGLADFNFNHTRPGKYLHRVQLTEEETGEIFYKKLGFIFLELPNFNQEEGAVKTELECWLYMLRNMGKMEKIPVILNKKVFQKLFKIAEVSNLKEEEYMLYQKDVLDKWTEYSVLKTAEDKGIEKGAEQKSYEVVSNLLSSTDFGIAKIALLSGVTKGFVKKVQDSLKEKK